MLLIYFICNSLYLLIPNSLSFPHEHFNKLWFSLKIFKQIIFKNRFGFFFFSFLMPNLSHVLHSHFTNQDLREKLCFVRTSMLHWKVRGRVVFIFKARHYLYYFTCTMYGQRNLLFKWWADYDKNWEIPEGNTSLA